MGKAQIVHDFQRLEDLAGCFLGIHFRESAASTSQIPSQIPILTKLHHDGDVFWRVKPARRSHKPMTILQGTGQ